ELDVGDHLIIATATGVEFPAHVAQALDQGALDVRVNVFQLDGISKLAALDLAGNVIEGADDLPSFVGRHKPYFRQHPGVSLAGADVLAIKAAVEADRLSEGFDAIVGLAAE